MKLKDLLVKDMKNILYDVKSLAILLLMPVVLMTILGMSLSGVFGDETESGIIDAHIGIVKAYDMDEEMYKVQGKVDLTTIDQVTIDALNAEKIFFEMMDNEDLDFITYEVMTEDDGLTALESGEIEALVILPKDFLFNSYMRLQGSRLVTEITYYINEERDFIANIVLGIIQGYADMNNHIYAQQYLLTKAAIGAGNMAIQSNMTDMFDMTALEDNALTLTVSSLESSESINSFQYYAAAIMCMFLLYTAGIGGRALLEERQEQTIQRITVSGNGLGLIMTSNYIRVMCLAMVQSVIMIVYSAVVLGVDWGSLITVILTIILSSFAVASIGMLIGVVTLISNNYKVANAFEFGIVYVMALIGGSYIPVEVLPEPMQRIGFLAVNGQALNMYVNGMYRLPIGESLPEITAILIFSLVFISLSVLLIRGKGRELAC